MFAYSPKDKIIAEFIKMTLFKSLHTLPFIPNMLSNVDDSCQFFFSLNLNLNIMGNCANFVFLETCKYII